MLSPWQRGAWHQGKGGKSQRQKRAGAGGEPRRRPARTSSGRCLRQRAARQLEAEGKNDGPWLLQCSVEEAALRQGDGSATTGQEAVERPNAGELLGRRKWRWQSFTPRGKNERAALRRDSCRGGKTGRGSRRPALSSAARQSLLADVDCSRYSNLIQIPNFKLS
jgi:hypothetical protein